jgi:hypothetical protein
MGFKSDHGWQMKGFMKMKGMPGGFLVTKRVASLCVMIWSGNRRDMGAGPLHATCQRVI